MCSEVDYAAVAFFLHHLCCFASFLSPLTSACSHHRLLFLSFSLSKLCPVPFPPSLPRASSGSSCHEHLLWPREERSGKWGRQLVTQVGTTIRTSRVQPQKQELLSQVSDPRRTEPGRAITIQGNLRSCLFLGCSGSTVQLEPKEILQLISLTG